MSGEGEESGDTQPPTSAPETVQTPASAAVPQPPQRSGHGHRHHPIEFRFLDELKRRNVGRVAILYLVVCWLILEPVHVIFHMLEVPVWANRLVIILMALGFPAVTIFAWVYEITPEGLKPTAEIPHGQSIRRQTGRRIDRAIIVVLVLALTYFVVDKFWISKHALSVEGEKALNAPATAPLPAVISDKSIAVLPFADMSEKKDQEYFGDGMAEEIIDLLSKIPGLRVVGRTSSFAFKGKADDLRTIGTKLGAKFVIEGSVRRTADRVRITAQLISTESGLHVWSGTYDRDMGDSLRIQDDIAAQLVRTLQVEVGTADLPSRPVISNVQAYDSYLRGRHARDRNDKDGAEQAVAYYEDAVRLEPSFIPATEALASAYYYLGAASFVEPGSAFERARKQTQIVLARDPANAGMHALLAKMHEYDLDWVAADRELQQALALDSNDGDVLTAAAFAAERRGRNNEAQSLISRALAKDPLNPAINFSLGDYLSNAGQFGEAEAQLLRTLQISPTHAWARFTLGQVLLARGRLPAALEAFNQTQIPDARLVGRAATYFALHEKSKSDQAMRQLEVEWGPSKPYEVAQAHAYRDEMDLALPWLIRAAAQKDDWVAECTGDPAFAKFANDPRYRAWLKSANPPP